MSERVWAKIEIGGTVSRPQLTRLVQEFGVLPLSVVEADALSIDLEMVPPEAVRFLELEDSEARGGQFEELEAYLVEQAIPFDRASDGTYEYGPDIRRFRPGLTNDGGSSQPQIASVVPCDHENRPVVLASDVVKALSETRTRGELAARLKELCGLDVPDLPALNVVEENSRGGTDGRG